MSNPSGADVIGLFILIIAARFVVGVVLLAIYSAVGDAFFSLGAPVIIVGVVTNWAPPLLWLYATLRYVTGHRAPWSRGLALRGRVGGAVGPNSLTERLTQLEAAHRSGLVTDAEYSAAKRTVLDSA